MDKNDLWIVEYFSEIVTKYPGKAIAVVNEQLMAIGDSEVEGELVAKEKYPDKIPSVLTVPDEEDMACLLNSWFASNNDTRKVAFQKI
jgi:hypothetical protein